MMIYHHKSVSQAEQCSAHPSGAHDATVAVIALAALAILASCRVYADCTPPDSNITIPSGATASRDDMVAAQKAVKGYDTAVKAYSDCLQQEVDAKVAAGGDKSKLSDEYGKKSNAEVDKLQKIADKFNTELHAFKAKNTG